MDTRREAPSYVAVDVCPFLSFSFSSSCSTSASVAILSRSRAAAAAADDADDDVFPLSSSLLACPPTRQNQSHCSGNMGRRPHACSPPCPRCTPHSCSDALRDDHRGDRERVRLCLLVWRQAYVMTLRSLRTRCLAFCERIRRRSLATRDTSIPSASPIRA